MAEQEIRNYDELKDNEGLKKDEQLQKLITQINEIKDTTNKNDDRIDGVFNENQEGGNYEIALNQGLLESLNNQDIGTLQILVGEVGRINRDLGLNLGNHVKNSLNSLSNLLLQVLNQKQNHELLEQGRQSFDKFKGMIEGKNKDNTNTLNKLNSLSKKEMEEVLKYVNDDNNKSDVYALCYSMKDALANGGVPSNFKRTDQNNFTKILVAIENKYPELKQEEGEKPGDGEYITKKERDRVSDKIKESQLNELFPENLTADDLNQILSSHTDNPNFKWDGGNILEGFSFKKGNDNEHIDANKFLARFREYNEQRIKSVEKAGNNLIPKVNLEGLSYDEETRKFMKGGIEVGFSELSGVDGSNKYGEGFNLLSIGELDANHFEDIKKGWEKELKKRIQESNEHQENDGSGGFEGVDNINANLDIVSINSYISGKIGEGKDILRMNDKGLYECNMGNVKEFLGKIVSKKDVIDGNIAFTNDFIKVGSDSRKAWLASVQLLMNYKILNNGGKKLDVDGKYGRDSLTGKAIRKFQSDNGLKPDSIPGPLTLRKMLEEKNAGDIVEEGNGDGNNGKNAPAETHPVKTTVIEEGNGDGTSGEWYPPMAASEDQTPTNNWGYMRGNDQTQVGSDWKKPRGNS